MLTRTALLARLRRCKLDQALSEGADLAGSPLLAARAAQLSGNRTRRRIADGLERIALSPERPPIRSRIVPSPLAVRANRPDLLQLARELREDRPLYVRGIAILMVLLTDGAGPAYTDRHGEAIAQQLQRARLSLMGSDQETRALDRV